MRSRRRGRARPGPDDTVERLAALALGAWLGVGLWLWAAGQVAGLLEAASFGVVSPGAVPQGVSQPAGLI